MIARNDREGSTLGIDFRSAVFVAQAEGESEILAGTPFILTETIASFAADIVARIGTFVEVVGDAQQEIGETVAAADAAVRIRPDEGVAAVAKKVVQGIVLVGGESRSELPGVIRP